MMDVNCDSCKQDFTINKLKELSLSDGVKRTYFVCPHCNVEYTAFYTNKEIRKKQQVLNNLKDKYMRAKTQVKLQELNKQIEISTKEIDDDMTKLRQEQESLK